MTYRIPLHDRLRYARAKRDRYYSDPDYRLQRINEARERRGREPYPTLDDVPMRRAA